MALVLQGAWVRLEPLEPAHVDGLVVAAASNPSLYDWSIVPQGSVAMAEYVRTALTWRDAGIAIPFVTVRASDGCIVGSTRFFDMETWSWPQGHARFGQAIPDVCEIGYTWLTASAIRTQINTEAKLLMLTHAFECGKHFASAFTPMHVTRARAPRSNGLARVLKASCERIAWRWTSRRETRLATRSLQRNGPRSSSAWVTS